MTTELNDRLQSGISPRLRVSRRQERLSSQANALIAWFDDYESIAVAFSGGVDSSVVLAAALRSSALRSSVRSVTALTARSPSVAMWQLELAESIANELGATHQIIDTNEVDLPAYNVNDSGRCFHCKQTLYQFLLSTCESLSAGQSEGQWLADTICVSGTNADDLGDYRPGITAGDQAGVRKPLAELGLCKADVRAIATEFGLSNADLPASPCLASRIAYGVSVTRERLSRVEQAEDYLRTSGLRNVRVRLHEGELARIEVPADQIAGLMQEPTRSAISDRMVELGFQYVTIDLQGFSSGSMNRPLVSLQSPSTTAAKTSRNILRETP